MTAPARLALAACLALAGCGNFTAPRYSVASDNVVAMRRLQPGIAVGIFRGAPLDAYCRAMGPVLLPDNLAPAEYIARALRAELQIAGVHAEGPARIVLSGTVHEASYSSVGGAWVLRMTLQSSNGQQATASGSYPFASAFSPENACKQAADALVPAVQDLIGAFVRSPRFVDLTR